MQPSAVYSQPVTLLDVLAGLRRARVAIVLGAFTGFLLALGFLATATPFYKAQMIVGAASPMRSNEPAEASQRAHVEDDPGADNFNFVRFQATLAGIEVAGLLLKDERVFQGLTQEHPYGLLRAQTDWTPEKLAAYIKQRVRILSVGDTPLRRLTYYHPSPQFAAYFVARLHDVTDDLIRKKVRNDVAERVDYLQKAVVAVANPDHRRVLTDLLLEQERELMLASVEQPYSAIVVEPAASSYKPEWPGHMLAFASFIAAGALLGFVVHGLRRAA